MFITSRPLLEGHLKERIHVKRKHNLRGGIGVTRATLASLVSLLWFYGSPEKKGITSTLPGQERSKENQASPTGGRYKGKTTPEHRRSRTHSGKLGMNTHPPTGNGLVSELPVAAVLLQRQS